MSDKEKEYADLMVGRARLQRHIEEIREYSLELSRVPDTSLSFRPVHKDILAAIRHYLGLLEKQKETIDSLINEL